MPQSLSNTKIAIIIPARYQSSRFPGKPLAEIAGTPMIKRVWDICSQATNPESVYVATDDNKIAGYCESQSIQTLMTSAECLTGTDRVYEASLQVDADIYLNVQGDEPLVDPEDIRIVIEAASVNPGSVLNAMCRISDESEFLSVSVPKVVTRQDRRLLYMSRAGIPANKQSRFVEAYKQVCIYAFPKHALKQYYENKNKTPVEAIEDIEILRFLEMGLDVHMIEVSKSSIAVDFPDDIKKVEEALGEKS